jgi:hypothetical protein
VSQLSAVVSPGGVGAEAPCSDDPTKPAPWRRARARLVDVAVEVLLVSLRPACEPTSEGSENWGAMPTPSSGGFRRDLSDRGRLAASTSAAVVHVFSEHTERGPTSARSANQIEPDTVLEFFLLDREVGVV